MVKLGAKLHQINETLRKNREFKRMPKINKEWHLANKMPGNATVEQKIKWHTGHAEHCRCRDSKAHLLKLKKKLEAKYDRE